MFGSGILRRSTAGERKCSTTVSPDTSCVDPPPGGAPSSTDWPDSRGSTLCVKVGNTRTHHSEVCPVSRARRAHNRSSEHGSSIASVRNSCCGKVMFLHLVCDSVHKGGCLPLGPDGVSASGSRGCTPPRQTPLGRHPSRQTSPRQTPPLADTPLPGRHLPPPRQTSPPRDGHCSGRCATHWYAFLF